MSLRFCMILFILCFISHGQSSNGGPCTTRKVTEASMYAFVGGAQFPSAPYWDQNALQETTDSSVDITEDCQVGDGQSYRGTISVTKTGLTCQRWDRQTPHSHYWTPENYPSAGLEQNYCRNPDGNEPGVWCYTMDPSIKYRWDFCDVPVCGCPFKPGGSDYRGNLSVTTNGKTCQRWDSDSPHSRAHGYRAEDYPYLELVENYCRNPDGTSFTIWCYTTHPSTRWEYCSDPRCPGS
ncbi:plasminogen-like isoform X2 [Branchiostoma floridae x Branchiostoma belcheri]